MECPFYSVSENGKCHVPGKVGFLHYKAAPSRDKIKGTPCSTIRSPPLKFKFDTLYAINMYGGEEVYIHPFFVSALVIGERSAPFLDHFTSGKINCVGPRMVACVVHTATGTLGEEKNLLLLPGFKPRIIQALA